MNDYPAAVGFITFATMASKHRYLKAYLDALNVKSAPIPEKYQLQGKNILFVEAEDTRDMNYRERVDNKSRTKCCIFSLIVLLLVIIFTAIIIIVSTFINVPTPQLCVNKKEFYTATASIAILTGSTTSVASSVECLCGFTPVLDNLNE